MRVSFLEGANQLAIASMLAGESSAFPEGKPAEKVSILTVSIL
jgi:hypothetical protein